LHELGCSSTQFPTLCCDNLSAIFLVANPAFTEKLTAKHISVHFIYSNDQIADITKSLTKTRFQVLRVKFTVCPNELSLRGL
jgi:hypothetical protein